MPEPDEFLRRHSYFPRFAHYDPFSLQFFQQNSPFWRSVERIAPQFAYTTVPQMPTDLAAEQDTPLLAEYHDYPVTDNKVDDHSDDDNARACGNDVTVVASPRNDAACGQKNRGVACENDTKQCDLTSSAHSETSAVLVLPNEDGTTEILL